MAVLTMQNQQIQLSSALYEKQQFDKNCTEHFIQIISNYAEVFI